MGMQFRAGAIWRSAKSAGPRKRRVALRYIGAHGHGYGSTTIRNYVPLLDKWRHCRTNVVAPRVFCGDLLRLVKKPCLSHQTVSQL